MMTIHLLLLLLTNGGYLDFLCKTNGVLMIKTKCFWAGEQIYIPNMVSSISPRFNYQHSFSDKTTLRFGLGNGFRVVNVFTEDHAALTGAREVVFNESLLPERSKNANINISTDQKTAFFDFHAEGSMFYTHFSNKIIPDFEANDNQIIYSNLDGYSVSKGLSLQVGLQCKEIPLKLNANGTLLDVVYLIMMRIIMLKT